MPFIGPLPKSSVAWRLIRASTIRVPLIGDILVRRALLSRHRKRFGALPRLDPPTTFNEHMLFRILYDRDPRLKVICDKIAAKNFISTRVGSEYVVPLLGAWGHPREIAWSSLPEKFVLKPSHSSGPFEIVRGAADRDIEGLTAKAKKWLRDDYFDVSLEWGYRGIPRCVLAEPLLMSSLGSQPVEAHAFTFFGKVALIRLLAGRKLTPGRSDSWYDVAGRRLAIKADLPSANVMLAESSRADMIAIAERISEGFSSLRVDFYLTGDGLKVGELTPYSFSAKAEWDPPKLDEQLGRLSEASEHWSTIESLLQ
jgi:TupA-like ATPgrasp